MLDDDDYDAMFAKVLKVEQELRAPGKLCFLGCYAVPRRCRRSKLMRWMDLVDPLLLFN